MKRIFILMLAGTCGALGAQPNPSAPKPSEPQTVISSDSGYFDGQTHQMVYVGQVVATDGKSILHCGRLTVDLPPNGGHPTGILAETNVVIDMLDEKGQTNHITAAKAVYAYTVANAVTNEVVTFTGGNPMPKVENHQLIIVGEPLVLNLVTKHFSGENYRTTFKPASGPGGGTNASPFNILK